MTEANTVQKQKSRGIRKSRSGKVVSKSGDKTVVVLVERRYHHPLYGKQLVAGKKMHTHDEKNEACVGDVVEIRECRPYSRLKRWRLVRIIESAAKPASEVK